jgi:hypothetical protein
MVRKPQLAHQPKSSKESRTGFEKMQLSHQRMRKDIKRILVERAKRTETGKPHHEPLTRPCRPGLHPLDDRLELLGRRLSVYHTSYESFLCRVHASANRSYPTRDPCD